MAELEAQRNTLESANTELREAAAQVGLDAAGFTVARRALPDDLRWRGTPAVRMLRVLRENGCSFIISASSRVGGSLLALIVIALFASVEVAPLMIHHDWLPPFPLRLKPFAACPFRLAANSTYHRPHHRAREIKRQLQDCQIKCARAEMAALLLLLLLLLL